MTAEIKVFKYLNNRTWKTNILNHKNKQVKFIAYIEKKNNNNVESNKCECGRHEAIHKF